MKEKLFLKLSNEAQSCFVCEQMQDKIAVLSESNGNINPKVMFIAEAPGRQGADRTRETFFGRQIRRKFSEISRFDKSQTRRNFYHKFRFMQSAKTSGANRKPTKKEIKNCSNFLEKTINLINPKIIVTLGSVALEALKLLEYHQFDLKTDVGKILRWKNKLLSRSIIQVRKF